MWSAVNAIMSVVFIKDIVKYSADRSILKLMFKPMNRDDPENDTYDVDTVVNRNNLDPYYEKCAPYDFYVFSSNFPFLMTAFNLNNSECYYIVPKSLIDFYYKDSDERKKKKFYYSNVCGRKYTPNIDIMRMFPVMVSIMFGHKNPQITPVSFGVFSLLTAMKFIKN